ncbi:transketolase [Streptomyces avermitilis]|uniref:Transketolase n=2 Tax=Streptomyces avermitilis TaxID=33903 RepID=Q82LW9_STRAW|nr:MULTISPECIES: transketolase [Streptomyces]KUN55830.1 transketolase [Streptomyces avermitilis]MYS97516.1 transketolase [Streptomyces sp. SID5469]OOV25599.1 transketolase [Streptomyces avermitilis]BAC69602.1 putative transketolase [Streptomyces avermitilis MA-4680 = NBRC 14893]BBJ49623.1 transketolase [Streptomyces avermitilis]
MNTRQLTELGQQLRVDSVRAADAASSGHPTSSMSAADLMAVLLAHHLRYDFDRPAHPGNDRFILSKGHASPLLYAAYKAAGAIDDAELLTFRELGSRLEGHPTPRRLPWVETATGSLGQGLPVGVGIALSGKRLERTGYRVWVLCGDSELAEGSVWEAAEHAGYEHLDNLTAIVDVNRLGQRGPTRHGHDLDAYARRFQAFGWHTIEIDGHDVDAVDRAYGEAESTSGQPTVILARTLKGKGVAAVEDREGLHGKPLPDAEEAIAELGGVRELRIEVQDPPAARVLHAVAAPGQVELPRYDKGDEVATRDAYGQALTALGGAREDVVAIDGEVGDSTRSEYFAKEYPDRYFECYIAEQQMVAAAVGLAARGWVPYAATFAAFLTRAHDFVRMASISGAGINLVGSHAGVSIGQDGPSQMGLEDLAMFRSVYDSTVLYPCDANQTAKLVAAMAGLDGVRYLRTSRGASPVLYGPDEEFPVGGSKVLRSSGEDRLTLVAAGVTVHEALAAADSLAEAGIRARVIDLYSVKPVDRDTLRQAAEDTGCLLTVEDHREEGGIGDAVLDAFLDGRPVPRLVRLAVRTMPGSASPAEQLHAAGIDAESIATAARLLVEQAVVR